MQCRYEMMLMEMRKGYDLRRLTLGINLSHVYIESMEAVDLVK